MTNGRPSFHASRPARVALASVAALGVSAAVALAVGLRVEPFPVPDSVHLEGSLAQAVGCAPSTPCPALRLSPAPLAPGWLDGLSTVGRRYLAPQHLPAFTVALDVPAGHHEYRVRTRGPAGEWVSGAGGYLDGAPFTLDLEAPRRVTFRFSPWTRWVATDVQHPLAIATGTFQRALGCERDWQDDCLQTWLQDADGDGLYTLWTRLIPPGVHEVQAVARGAAATPAPERTTFRVLRPAEEARLVWHPTWPKVVVEFPGRPPKAEAEAIAREQREERAP